MQGVLQPDMWNATPSDRWDWAALRKMISMNGVRNSLLVAPMPTASTSQILGNNECFEPYTSNIYSRRVLRCAFFPWTAINVFQGAFFCIYLMLIYVPVASLL